MKPKSSRSKLAYDLKRPRGSLKLISRGRSDRFNPKVAELDAVWKDNQRGILPKLLKLNQTLRTTEWPYPFNTTTHRIRQADARNLEWIPSRSAHLIVTSPPYWTLKQYETHAGQLGEIDLYEKFLDELDKAWAECACADPRRPHLLRRGRCVRSTQTRRPPLCDAAPCRHPGEDEKDRAGLPDAYFMVQDRQRSYRSKGERRRFLRQALPAWGNYKERRRVHSLF
jgi:hypothetical protein